MKTTPLFILIAIMGTACTEVPDKTTENKVTVDVAGQANKIANQKVETTAKEVIAKKNGLSL